MVGDKGFEPLASCSQGKRSPQTELIPEIGRRGWTRTSNPSLPKRVRFHCATHRWWRERCSNPRLWLFRPSPVHLGYLSKIGRAYRVRVLSGILRPSSWPVLAVSASARTLVDVTGIEPATCRVQTGCSPELSYTPTLGWPADSTPQPPGPQPGALRLSYGHIWSWRRDLNPRKPEYGSGA